MIAPRAVALSFVLVVALTRAAPAADPPGPSGAPPVPDAAALNKLSARLAPVDLSVDVQALPANERAALVELIAAAKIMDGLFLRQAWAGNDALLLDLVRDRPPLGGIGPKPPQANFYPADTTKADVEAWMHALPAPARTSAEGFFTTVR